MTKKHKPNITASLLRGLLTLGVAGALASNSYAQKLQSSDGVYLDFYGYTVSASSDSALIGAYGDDDKGDLSGSAYYYKGLNSKSGSVTQDVKLLASDGAANNRFGYQTVSLAGDSALVAASYDDDKGDMSGSAYYYKGLNSKSGTVTQNVKLLASDGKANDYFGSSLSLSSDAALVGALGNDGAAYYFKGLNSKSGIVNQNVKLLASDGSSVRFGQAVSLLGDSALVGADRVTVSGKTNAGAAYYFTGLNAKSGTINQDLKLVASDPLDTALFGFSASLQADAALVGAYGHATSIGAAYYFKGLSTKTGTITQNVKLMSSNGKTYCHFGRSVSLSGDSALIGAPTNDYPGFAYYFKGLNSKTGTVREDVLLVASTSSPTGSFGRSVSMDGDRFVIGSYYATGNVAMSGAAYAGDIRAFTALNAGSASVQSNGLTATLNGGDLIVGETTSNNTNTISTGDKVTVTSPGSVAIGKEAGANNNKLIVDGSLVAPTVTVGGEGNSGNELVVNKPTGCDIGDLYIHPGNKVILPAGSTLQDLINLADNVYVKDADGNWVKLTTDTGATYDPVTGIISLLAKPVISTFAGTPPSAPTASISASPSIGYAPLNSTVTWNSGNASTVNVSGPNLMSTTASGNKAFSNLVQGSYTYTITANPKTATLNWTTTGEIDSLVLTTPGGNVNVTGQTSRTVSVSGAYTLTATNSSGTVSLSTNLTIPAAKTMSTTITVNASLPTIPAVIDPNTIVVTPGTGGSGATITGEIDTSVTGAEGTFDLDKLMVYTTTNLKTATAWPAATKGTHYSVALNAAKTTFTVTINPLSGSDTVRFYRVATSTKAFNANGTPAADSVTKYNTTISGQYKVTIPAGKMQLVANQLETADNTVGTLFASLPNRSSVDVVDTDPESASYGLMLGATRRNSGAGWTEGASNVLPVGYAAYVSNGSASVTATLNFSGVVRHTQTYLLPEGVAYMLGSAVPVAVANPVNIGYSLKRRDYFDKMDGDGVTDSHSVNNTGTAWSGSKIPSFAVGEGYFYQPFVDNGWEQTLTVSDSTSIVQ